MNEILDLFIVENDLSNKEYWYIFPKKRNNLLVPVKKEINSAKPGSPISLSLSDTSSPSKLSEFTGVNVDISNDVSASSSPTRVSNESDKILEDAEVTEGFTTDTTTVTTLEDFVPIESIKIISETSSNSDVIAKQFFDVSLGFASTDFTYVDSSGNSDVKFIPGNKNFLSLNYSFQIRKNFFLRTGIVLLSFGTTSLDLANGNSYEWDEIEGVMGAAVEWVDENA